MFLIKKDIDLAEKRMEDWRQNMKKGKVRTFQSRLMEDIKDREFKAHYQEEKQALKLAMKIAVNFADRERRV